MDSTNASNILSKILLPLTAHPQDVWTVDDALKGVSILGGTGSGKTSASGKKLAQIFLQNGWGGLVLCAKTDEAQLWEYYCKKYNRSTDLIRFSKDKKHTSGKYAGEHYIFNPIDYEMKRSGPGAGETHNITNIFMNIYRMGNRIAGDGEVKEDRFWDSALKRCLNRIIELIKLSEEVLSYANMVKILSTSGTVEKEKITNAITAIERKEKTSMLENDENYCLKCIVHAYSNVFHHEDTLTDERATSFNLVDDYFTNVLPSLGSKTKSIITESFLGLAEPFLSGLLFKHFAGETNIFPEEAYLNNKIIVLDFPIKEHLDAGIMAQTMFKLLFQQAIERRNTDDFPNPVFLWCDEAQYFINPYDQIFLTTARSSRTATVYLSQNISNYLAVLGADNAAKAKVDSLMGNLCTKIFHANSDAETNEYASRLVGSALAPLGNVSTQQSTFGLQDSYSQGMSMQYLPQIQPREFTTLKTGGDFNNFEVQGIMTMSGRKWSTEKNYLRLSFTQDFSTKQ